MDKVVLIATGGTIAGVDKEYGPYEPGVLEADQILRMAADTSEGSPGETEGGRSVLGPGDETFGDVEIETLQFCNLNSDDMTGALWLELSRTIDDICGRSDVRGVVVTHGTDTMEETAFFLLLTLKTEKPVIMTGSMRPATHPACDGPENLRGALALAARGETGLGVRAFFAGKVYDAMGLVKVDSEGLDAFDDFGIKNVRITDEGSECADDKINPLGTGAREKNYRSFDISGVKTLPRVSVIYFHVDADAELLRYAAGKSDGIVIAGAGAGEMSRTYLEIAAGLSIPVMVCSRIERGFVDKSMLRAPGLIPGGSLSPSKAAVILRLMLLL